MTHAQRHGELFEIVIENPPVNALGGTVRQSLERLVAEGQRDSSIKLILIRGAGALFSAGADIKEFAATRSKPDLPAVCDLIEASAKPVVAAVRGACMGGALEIALACHYRLAAPDATFGLPEVTLGLLPGAGGTQRLPRLIGAEAALDMIVTGKRIGASAAQELRLVDAVIAETPFEEIARDFARRLSERGPRRSADQTVAGSTEPVEQYASRNKGKIGELEAPLACLQAVRAAFDMPLAQGLAFERALFDRLVTTDQSKAQRYIFFAERQAAKIDDLPSATQSRPVRRVGIVGAGTMGGGIAMNFLNAAIPVTIIEASAEPLSRGIETIERNYRASAARGRMSEEQVARARSLLTPTLDYDALAACDLVIEAAYESLDVKREIFSKLDAIAMPGAILASNTSYLSIDEIAGATKRPRDVLGLHFFSPANVMKLLEVVRGAETAPDVLATAMSLARQIGKTAVVSRVCYGFIGNRMLIPRQGNAIALVLEGADPSEIDQVHTSFGMPMGPFQMADLAGVDIGWHRDPHRIESLQDALCAAGRWGQKMSAGYYDYDDDRRASASLVAQQIIEDYRSRIGVTPRKVEREEIIVRTLYTMLNEAAKIVEEGIVQRPSDIDVVYVNGYGWPRHKGGPMFWADTIGVSAVVAGLQAYRERLGDGFAISELLLRKARDGETFVR